MSVCVNMYSDKHSTYINIYVICMSAWLMSISNNEYIGIS